MKNKKLTDKEWNDFVKEMLKTFATGALSGHGDNAKAAKALGLSVSAVEQMKSSGKGSPKSWIKLAAYKANLSPDEIRSFFKNIPGILKQIKPMSEVDGLFEEFKKSYSNQEIAALLQLMIAKREVEDFVGVNIKVSKKKTAKKKTTRRKKSK